MRRDPEFTESAPPLTPTRRRRLIVGVIVVMALLAVAVYAIRQRQAATGAGTTAGQGGPGGPGAAMGPRGPGGLAGPGAGRPTPVAVAAAASGDVDIVLSALGTATPMKTVVVKSRVQGELVRVHFQEGEWVKEGQLLAEIDPRAFQVQLAQAEGQYARDKAQLENAKVDLERYRGLVAQDSAPKQQLDTQAALVRQYEAALKVDQSQIDNARLQLAYARITAPTSGRVGLRQVDPGNMVTGSEANGLVVITQLQPITVLFTVPQDNVPAVMKRAQSGERIPVEAWDRAQQTRLASGELASVDNVIDPATGTVKLKARFANADGALFPNQFVNVRMKLDTLRGAVVIPSAAVQRGSQGMFVYVVKPDRTVTLRSVKLGPADGPRVAVSEGLAVGESVVVDGVDRLREGAKVEVVGERPQVKTGPDGKAVTPPRTRRGSRAGQEGGAAGGRPAR